MPLNIIIASMINAKQYCKRHLNINITDKAFYILVVLFTLVLVSCGDNKSSGIPAPIGDKAVLEKLATAYTDNVEKQQIAPASMVPKGKIIFIKQVFIDAGYDYSLTLLMLSGSQFDPAIKLHKDLAELVMLPQIGLSYDDYETIYSEEEVKALKVIQNTLRRK